MDGQVPWQTELEVVTPESVSFSYEVAGIGSRFLALLVDHVLESLAFGALLILTGYMGWMDQPYVVALLVSCGTLLYVGYFTLFEILWDGKTPGKRLMHLRVIRNGGYGLAPLESILRNLLRVVDFLPVFYGLGLITMFLSDKCRRLGDYVAGTIVIKDRGPAIPSGSKTLYIGSLSGLRSETQNLIRARIGLFTPMEMGVMRDYLRRRGELALEPRQKLTGRLSLAIRARLTDLNEMEGNLPGERLIEAVVAAYEEQLNSNR